MSMKRVKIDEKMFCKKYRTNVIRLIRAWKKGLSDAQISNMTGIDLAKIHQIKTDIEFAHRRLRLARGKDIDSAGQNMAQHHIFFHPFT